MQKLTVTTLEMHSSGIKIHINGQTPQCAWLENINKHYPDIFALTIYNNNCIVFNPQNLKSENFHIDSCCNLKLSMCKNFKKIPYELADSFKVTENFPLPYQCQVITDNKPEIIFKFKLPQQNKKQKLQYAQPPKNILYNINNTIKTPYLHRPTNTMVWGTCFSRSIFNSSPYFNPGYKKFFKINYTAFHSSFISIMSKATADNSYKNYKDLIDSKISDYIHLEFQKNIFEYIKKFNTELIIIDNYTDAVLPVIEIFPDCFLTYNKYFSESIYKKNFSDCKIFYPGTPSHLKLYKKSLMRFSALLHEFKPNLKIILIGSRLSHHKINPITNNISQWNEKMPWILESNNNWDIVDNIFLRSFPKAHYIDMRKTKWISDINSPILGGSSPSHYQSGYYKELFEKIITVFFYNGDNICKSIQK